MNKDLHTNLFIFFLFQHEKFFSICSEHPRYQTLPFFVNNSISFGLLYRLFITRRFYPTYAPGGGQLRLLLYTDTGLHFDNLRTTEDGGG